MLWYDDRKPQNGDNVLGKPFGNRNIIIPRRTLEEKGINMYVGQQIEERVPMYDKDTYKELNDMLMERNGRPEEVPPVTKRDTAPG